MVHATYPDNYTYAAVHDQLQTFRRKEKKLKGSLAILKSFRLLTGQRKTGTKWHPNKICSVKVYGTPCTRIDNLGARKKTRKTFAQGKR